MRNAVREPHRPISDPDRALTARFAESLSAQRPLEPAERIGAAVSGGPDSLALLLLAHAALPGRVEAVTIDHGLRPESAAEAAMVAGVCDRLDVPHETLARTTPLPRGRGMQAAARDLRYVMMRQWCGRRRLSVLLTAHHADDQAETLLMRMRRGAGIGGLGSIRPVRPLEPGKALMIGLSRLDLVPVTIVRPLLDFTKAELVAIVRDAGLAAVADPSNDDEGYDRTHARRLLGSTDWLDARRLAASAAALADAAHALEWAAAQEGGRRVRNDGEGRFSMDHEGLPAELQRRIVESILIVVERRVLGLPPLAPVASIRGPELTRLVARLRRGESATLGHVLARPGQLWRFMAAPPRKT